MRLSGLFTPTRNGPELGGARPSMGPNHDVTVGIMILAFGLEQTVVIGLISIGGKFV